MSKYAPVHHAFRLRPGEDLRQRLMRFMTEEQIDAAWIVTTVGSLASANLRFAGAKEGTHLKGLFEIVSLVGTLSRHGCHLHIALADGKGQMIGGHLLEGSPVHTTAEVIIGTQEGWVFTREHDPETGYDEWVNRQR
jgi:predicted DNA-binding protein with PD1-like motif